MLKFWGAICILMVPLIRTGASYLAFQREQKENRSFCEMIMRSKIQVQSYRTPLPELIYKFQMMDPFLFDFWTSVLKADHGNRIEIPLEFRKAVQSLELSEKEKMRLSDFADLFQTYEIKELTNELQRMYDDLTEMRKKKEREFYKSFKAETGVRFSAALLILILLL